MPNKYISEKGFLTLEVVFALCFFSLFIVGVLALVFSNQFMAVDAQNNAQALGMANNGMESALAQGFGLSAPADVISDNFTEHIGVNWLADYATEISSKTSYSSAGRVQSSELDSLVTDTQSGLGHDTCALGFFGNWGHPMLRGSYITAAGNPATDVDAQNGKAYIATNGATQSLPDFFVVDASDIINLSLLKSINTGPGLNSLQVAGDYVFAANSSINGQLQIIKISDPSNPTVMLNVKFADAASGGIGNTIFYSKGKVYIGTPKNDGPEFYVYNVANPLAPVFLGEFEVGSVVNKIYVYGNYAYLATADQNHFRILDVSDPGHISDVGHFSGIGWAAQSGQSLAMLGGRAVFGRAGGLSSLGYPELYMLDVNIPSSVQNLNSADVNISINDIFLRGNLAFMGTNKNDGEFQVYDLTNNQFTLLSKSDLPNDAVALDCDGQNFFVSQSGSQILQIISAQ